MPRLRMEEITCPLGTLVDLSLTGMRVRGPSEMSGVHNLTLSGFGIEAGPLPTRVVWCRSIDRHTFEAGLIFGKLSVSQRNRLSELALVGRRCNCLTAA